MTSIRTRRIPRAADAASMGRRALRAAALGRRQRAESRNGLCRRRATARAAHRARRAAGRLEDRLHQPQPVATVRRRSADVGAGVEHDAAHAGRQRRPLVVRRACASRASNPKSPSSSTVAPRAGMSLDELRGCLAWVAHAFEIVHTHYEGWRFTPADTAADFALHGRLLRRPARAGASVGRGAGGRSVGAARRVAVRRRGSRTAALGSVVLDGPLQALKTLIDSMAARHAAMAGGGG